MFIKHVEHCFERFDYATSFGSDALHVSTATCLESLLKLRDGSHIPQIPLVQLKDHRNLVQVDAATAKITSQTLELILSHLKQLSLRIYYRIRALDITSR